MNEHDEKLLINLDLETLYSAHRNRFRKQNPVLENASMSNMSVDETLMFNSTQFSHCHFGN